MLSPALSRPGIDEAAHVVGLEERRLLVDERDEAEGPRLGTSGKPPRELEQRRDAGAVVVRPGTARNRVVVAAKEDDLRWMRRSGQRGFDIADRHSRHLIGLTAWLVSVPRELALDVLGSPLQHVVAPDVALANGAGEHLDVGQQAMCLGVRSVNSIDP